MSQKTETAQKNETAQKLQSKVCLDQQFCRVKSTMLHKLEEQKNQVTMYLQGNFSNANSLSKFLEQC